MSTTSLFRRDRVDRRGGGVLCTFAITCLLISGHILATRHSLSYCGFMFKHSVVKSSSMRCIILRSRYTSQLRYSITSKPALMACFREQQSFWQATSAHLTTPHLCREPLLARVLSRIQFKGCNPKAGVPSLPCPPSPSPPPPPSHLFPSPGPSPPLRSRAP